jgi:hypothetical protein
VSQRRCICFFLSLLAVVNTLAAASIDDLRKAAAARNLNEVMLIAQGFANQNRGESTLEGRRQATAEMGALTQASPTYEGLEKLIGELEVSLEKGQKETASRKAFQIGYYAVRLQQANGPDAVTLFASAREQAKYNPSITNFYALAVRASAAKQHAAAVEAAQQALALRAEDRLASTTAELPHTISLIAADSSFELGRMGDAERYLLGSLEPEGQRWRRLCPDWVVAAKLLRAGRRDVVTQYFEKAYKQDFPKCQASMSLWIADLKAGKHPNFAAPPKD